MTPIVLDLVSRRLAHSSLPAPKKVFGNTVTFIAADIALNAQCAVARVPRAVLNLSSGTWGDVDSGATLSMSLGDLGNAAAGLPRQPRTSPPCDHDAGGRCGWCAGSVRLLYEF
jgi:hypothetical protein